MAMQTWTDSTYSSRDGLKLAARYYPAPGSTRRPAVCLPGLTRNARDFHVLASALADAHGACRPVYALDLRGRGASQHDPQPANYSVATELGDVLDFMTLTGLHDAAIIGTSRGGLITMAMAAARPTAMGAVVLNDIGPVLEPPGLARIVAYVGKMPLPHSWDDAARQVRDINKRDFTAMSDADWEAFARQIFNEKDGRPAPGYDPALAQTLSIPTGSLPDLWPQFIALSRVPTLVVRGANSDLLSEATMTEMARRHPRMRTHRVPNEGHAPLLRDEPSIKVIHDFLTETDATYAGAH
jgi:pimeloyl-ACP methyl ester carboxylesterase